MTRKPLETVTILRQTARWLDGRASEDYWDAVADDREFDGDIDLFIRKERDNEGYGAKSRPPLHTVSTRSAPSPW